MADVVCFGDLLIDFVPTVTGTGLADAPAFVKAPGGAAANVAVGLARLGVTSAFMGKVGDDPFGHFLADTLRGEGVDVGPLRFEPRARTALAFVSLRADGEREFLFYRHPSADMLFTPDEVDADAIAAATRLPLRLDQPGRRAARAPRRCTPPAWPSAAGQPDLLRRQSAPALVARRRGRPGRHPRRAWPRRTSSSSATTSSSS